MMSLATIRRMSEEQAERAAQENQTPYILFDSEDIRRMPGGDQWNGKRAFPFPNIGSYVPDGWELTDETYFVDSSGLGADYEPALTMEQFNAELMKLHYASRGRRTGLAITEVGQFQLYVSVFTKKVGYDGNN